MTVVAITASFVAMDTLDRVREMVRVCKDRPQGQRMSVRQLSIASGNSDKWLEAALRRGSKKFSAEELGKMARAAGVSERWLVHGEGAMDAGTASAPAAVAQPPRPSMPSDEDSPLERAAFEVATADAGRYDLADFNAVRVAARHIDRKVQEEGDPHATARAYLEAARRLRQQGRPTDPLNLAAAAVQGINPTPQQLAQRAAQEEELNREAEERAKASGLRPMLDFADKAAARARKARGES